MQLRTLIFWPHLVAGVLAGVLILVMSVTGVLLTYERQLIAWSDNQFRSTVSSPGARRVAADTIVASLRAAQPDVEPVSVTISSEPTEPVAVAVPQRTFYLDAYSGAFLGEGTQGMRRAMSELRSWHRWLAVEGEGRATARAFTGWSNLLFAFIVLSGTYLWLPRTWTWLQFKAVLTFNGRARGKARDFNWHNVFGIWSAIPLFIVVVSAVPISFPWANAAIYQALGEPVPAGRGGGPGGELANRERGGAESRANQGPTGRNAQGPAAGRGRARSTPLSSTASLSGLEALLVRAEQQERGWRTIVLRLPASVQAPVTFTIDRGDGGQPHLRSTLTLARVTGDIESYETFDTLTLGRRIRNTMRFAHTGEVLGIPGQTIAGLVSAAGAVLVWTGIALAWRRLRSWWGRSRRAQSRAQSVASPAA